MTNQGKVSLRVMSSWKGKFLEENIEKFDRCYPILSNFISQFDLDKSRKMNGMEVVKTLDTREAWKNIFLRAST